MQAPPDHNERDSKETLKLFGNLESLLTTLIGDDSEAVHELYVSVGREALEKAAAALPAI